MTILTAQANLKDVKWRDVKFGDVKRVITMGALTWDPVLYMMLLGIFCSYQVLVIEHMLLIPN